MSAGELLNKLWHGVTHDDDAVRIKMLVRLLKVAHTQSHCHAERWLQSILECDPPHVPPSIAALRRQAHELFMWDYNRLQKQLEKALVVIQEAGLPSPLP